MLYRRLTFQRYYKSTPRQTESEGLDKHHCSRFHTKAKPVTRQQNPVCEVNETYCENYQFNKNL